MQQCSDWWKRCPYFRGVPIHIGFPSTSTCIHTVCNSAKCINGTCSEVVPCIHPHTFCTVVSSWQSFLSLLNSGGAHHLACAPWWCTLDDQLFLDWDQHIPLTIYTENNMKVVTQSSLYSWHKSPWFSNQSNWKISLNSVTKDSLYNTFNWSLYPDHSKLSVFHVELWNKIMWTTKWWRFLSRTLHLEESYLANILTI